MQQGGIIRQEMPIDASNVMLVCPHCKRPSKRGSALKITTGKFVTAKPAKQPFRLYVKHQESGGRDDGKGVTNEQTIRSL